MRLALRALLLASLFFFSAYVTSAKDDDAQNAAPLIMSIWDESRREYPKSYAINQEIEGVLFDGWVAGPEILSELGNDERLARIDAVIAARECDFNLDFSQGPKLLLPHISPASTAAELLLAKARLHIDAGEHQEAIDSIQGVFVLIRHLAVDHTLVAVLERAELATTASSLPFVIPPENWDAIDVESLLAEIQQMPAVDPFGLKSAVTQEPRIMSDWVIAQSNDNARAAEFWEYINILLSMDSDRLAKIKKRVKRFGGLERSAEAFRIAGAHQAAALDQDDPIAALERIAELVDAGEYGPLAPYFVSNVDRAALKVRQAEPSVEVLRIILQGMRDAPAAPLPKP